MLYGMDNIRQISKLQTKNKKQTKQINKIQNK
jgi:hypothetical protein